MDKTNIQKSVFTHQVYTVGKEEARRIIDKAKTVFIDDAAFINELEKIYNAK